MSAPQALLQDVDPSFASTGCDCEGSWDGTGQHWSTCAIYEQETQRANDE